MGLAENIKFLRKKMKLNQEELAKKLGVKQSSVSYWEIGKKIPRKEQMSKLVKFFKFSPNLLYSDSLKDFTDADIDISTFTAPYPIKQLSLAEILDYDKRKKLSDNIFIPNIKQDNEYIEYPNIVMYGVEDNTMAPAIEAKSTIFIQLDGPYKEGDIVVFHNTTGDKILIRQYQTIKCVPVLTAFNSKEIWPLTLFGRHFHYIGRVINNLTMNPLENAPKSLLKELNKRQKNYRY